MINDELLKMLDPETIAKIQSAFGPSQEERRAASNAGWISAGLGMMGARKGEEFSRLGLAGQHGLNVRDDVLRSQREQRLGAFGMARDLTRMSREDEEYKLAKQKREAMEAARTSAITPGKPLMPSVQNDDEGGAMPAYGASPPGFDFNRYHDAIAPIDPQAALQVRAAMQKESELDKINQKDFTPESFAEYQRTGNRAALRPLDVKGKWVDVPPPPGTDPGQQWQRNDATGEMRAVGTRAPKGTTVHIDQRQESAFQKKYGEISAQTFDDIQKGAIAAGQRLQSLSAIQALLTDVKTDATTPIGMQIAGYAKGIGLNLDANLPRKQAADAIANAMALESRSTEGGAGMPGAMSDKDREFLRAMNPNVSQTPEGRALIIEIQRRRALRTQQVARLAREYVAKHHKFEGFEQHAEAHFAGKDLFADLAARQATQQNGGRSASGRISGAPAAPANADGWIVERER